MYAPFPNLGAAFPGALLPHIAALTKANGVLNSLLYAPALQIPDPFLLLACTIRPWITGLILLGITVLVIRIGIRAVHQRAGEDILMIIGLLIAAVIVAGIALNPVTLTQLAAKLGAPGLNFTACPA